MTEAKQICEEMIEELVRARTKHPKGFNSLHEGYAVLLEEIDELWEEIKTQEKSYAKIRKEAIQSGAMVIRMIQDAIDGR